jgi:acetyl esterase/lipase
MRPLLAASVLVLLIACLQDSRPIPYYRIPDIAYCTGSGHPLLMDIFMPVRPVAKPTPAVLWVHGGGWERGAKNENSGALLLAAAGFVTASIDYRLSGEAPFPAALEDCKCAIRYLRANSGNYSIDPNRIGVAGTSAGGNLALLVGLTGEKSSFEGTGGWSNTSSRVSAVASWYGPTEFVAGQSSLPSSTGQRAVAKYLGGTFAENPEAYRRASPITYAHPGAPPILLIHGDRDALVSIAQSERLFAALQEAGDNVRFVKVSGAGHNFSPLEPISPSLDEIRSLTISFFKDSLALPPR